MVDDIDGESYARLERPRCPLCDGHHEPRRIAAHFGMTAMVAECRRCRIAYQTPRPTLEASIAYMNMRWKATDAYVADAPRQLAKAERQFELVAPLVGTRGAVLDFGAGIGTFVRAARAHGWQADGVEHSRSARERAALEHRVDLAADVAELDGEWDLITLWDVIEHLREPRTVVEALGDLLRPGGWMVFETGNWESWNRLASGDNWGLYLFDHQYYFSLASLRAEVSRAGLSNCQLLDGSRRRPPRRPGPNASAKDRARWVAYERGTALWPDLADIDIMVAAVQKPR